MNKKTTLMDVGLMFPEATIYELDDGRFSLPIDFHAPKGLHVVIPAELPIGVDEERLLPGGFQAMRTIETQRIFRTERAIQVATGRFRPAEGDKPPLFYLEEPLGAPQVLVAIPWEEEGEPPEWAAAGIKSAFAEERSAVYLERVAPLYYGATNPILQELPGEETERTGMDFWVLNDTGFYCEVCEARSYDLRQRIQMGQEQNDKEVCRRIMEELATEIANDPLLPGWKLSCADNEAELSLVDRSGRGRTTTVLYRPSFVRGIRDYITRGRAGTLTL